MTAFAEELPPHSRLAKYTPDAIAHEHAVIRGALACLASSLEETGNEDRLESEARTRVGNFRHLLEMCRRLVKACDPVQDDSLRFDELNKVNVQRCHRWHPDFTDPDDEWSIADWSNAAVGEAGEMANYIKKLRRLDLQPTESCESAEREFLVQRALKELGDTVIYMDLLATKLGFSLSHAVILAFNEVSNREGAPERLRPEDYHYRVKVATPAQYQGRER
jgi:hypothetical protein